MKLKYFLLPIIVAGIVIMIFYALQWKNPFKINTSQTAVVKQMQQLNRLETASFTIEKVIDASTNNDNAFQEFLYGDKILLIAHGDVVAGFDLANVNKNDITISNNNLTITLPSPEILYTKIDNDKTKVYDRRQGLLTKGNKDLESEARKSAEQQIQQAACDAGILTQAKQNAQKQLQTMFAPFNFSQVTINIPDGHC